MGKLSTTGRVICNSYSRCVLHSTISIHRLSHVLSAMLIHSLSPPDRSCLCSRAAAAVRVSIFRGEGIADKQRAVKVIAMYSLYSNNTNNNHFNAHLGKRGWLWTWFGIAAVSSERATIADVRFITTANMSSGWTEKNLARIFK